MIGPLKDNGKVGIIGAGPAGTLFALHLLRMGSEKGLSFDITIFDTKLFTDTGARGCNMCAGAISNTLIQKLKDMGIAMSKEVLRDKVTGYAMHLKGETVSIDVDPSVSIYTVFRAAGPLSSVSAEKIRGFDQELLECAIGKGVRFVHQRVRKVNEGTAEKISLVYGEDGKEWEGDLLVGAFGVNSRIGENLSIGYKPPGCWSACQTELEVSAEFGNKTIQNKIHIFSTENPHINYIAFTPKGNFITVTAIGENVKRVEVEKALKEEAISAYLPPGYTFKCHCHPKVPVTIARQPFSDRFVIIGDASASRYLKNGIESAFFTGKWAASTALNQGLSSEDFRKYYYSACRRHFSRDNVYGKILFGMYDLFSKNETFSRMNTNILREEQKKGHDSKILSSVFWHLFTGDAPYAQILRETVRWRILAGLFKEFFRSANAGRT
jgi:flavin-dependent dehydrogenase